jgi:GNAT superfamily N-acetyltransferase
MIKNTLYAKYIEERRGLSVLETEDSFLTYKFCGDDCFIHDMYVVNAKRTIGVGRDLIGQLEDLAKAAGCKYISANIDLRTPGATNCLLASLNVGFEAKAAQGDALLIIKDIGG